MTSVEAQQIVMVIEVAYPSYILKLGEARWQQSMAVYRMFLLDLDYRRADAAVARLIATHKFGLPSIADIRAAALEVVLGGVRAGGDAWGDVRKAVGRWGSNRTPGVDFEFADPLVARATKAIGWREICLSESAIADRARWIELYDRYASEARTNAACRDLPAVRALEGTRQRQIEQRTGTTSIADAVKRLPAPKGK